MKHLQVLFLIVLLFLTDLPGGKPATADIDYCDYFCHEGTVPNSACSCEPKLGCQQAEENLPLFRRAILDLHNTLRNTFAMGNYGYPQVANMMALSYDTSLEHVAECHALSVCKMVHDACRDTEDFNEVLESSPGQNLYASPTRACTGSDICNPSTDLDDQFVQKALFAWYMEKNSSNFAQLFSAKTYRIGCSFVVNLNDNAAERYLLVCNYGPGMNVSHNIDGKACSMCLEPCTPHYEGLCGEGHLPMDEDYKGLSGTNPPLPPGERLLNNLERLEVEFRAGRRSKSDRVEVSCLAFALSIWVLQ